MARAVAAGATTPAREPAAATTATTAVAVAAKAAAAVVAAATRGAALALGLDLFILQREGYRATEGEASAAVGGKRHYNNAGTPQSFAAYTQLFYLGCIGSCIHRVVC